MAGLLQELSERIKAVGGDWTKYTVVGSFLLYVVGYLALRFHLTAMGIGTDLAVLDERYLFTGARFLVYLASMVPNLILLALPVATIGWAASKLLPANVRAGAGEWIMRPSRLALFGIVLAVVVVQFVMRQCFVVSDLLLARDPPQEPRWLITLLLDDRLMPLYFSGLVAACALSLAILWMLYTTNVPEKGRFARGLLTFLAAVQVLLLPVNYGVLIVDKSLARVATLGDRPLADREEAWLVWEGKDGVTFLVRNQDRGRRSLVTLRRADVTRTEIVGFDRIVPALFATRAGHPQ